MAIAVAVLLFLIAGAFLCLMLNADELGEGLLMLFLTGLNVAAGVLNIVTDVTGIQIAVGVMLCVWAVVAVVLFVAVVLEVDNELGALLAAGAFLLLAWVTTFAILQLAIVV